MILRGNAQHWTLLHLKYRKHVIATNGNRGEEQDRTGMDGKDEILDVPLGTVAKRADSDDILFEITEDGKEYILTPAVAAAKATRTLLPPPTRHLKHAQPGEPGKEEWIVLELKLLADVGLSGIPERGQVNTAIGGVGSQTQNRRLSLHNTHPKPGRGVLSQRLVFCDGRHSGHH